MKEENYDIGQLYWDLKTDVIEGMSKIIDGKHEKLEKKDLEILNESIYNGGKVAILFPVYEPKEQYVKIEYEIKSISYMDVLYAIKDFYGEKNNYEKLGDYKSYDYIDLDNRVFTLYVKMEKKEDGVPVLYERQLKHFYRLLKVLEFWPIYIDTSPTGAGKTYVTGAIAKHFGLKVLLVAPLSLLGKWGEILEQFGVEVEALITYDSVRGTNKNPPKNGLITKSNNKFGYNITEKYEKLIEEGVLIVFDEVHKLKNDSKQTKACLALIRGLININKGKKTRSKIGLLGATPADKKIHAKVLVRLLGLTTKELYVVNDSNKIIPTGINDIINWGNKYDRGLTEKIFDLEYTSANIKDMMFDFVCKVGIPNLGSAMPAPKVGYYYNGLFKLKPKDKEALKLAVISLSRSLKFRKAENVGEEDRIELKSGFGNITPSLQKIENSKINALVRVIKEDLESDPNLKIIAYCNYDINIDTLVEQLSSYRPLQYHGRINISTRNKNIELFQANNNDYRLFIGNPKCGDVGIDLDDKYGNHPRIMYIMPSYDFIALYQSAGRVNRLSSKSFSTVIFFYGNDEGAVEKNLLDALARKSEAAASYTLATEIPPFPGDYDTYEEK